MLQQQFDLLKLIQENGLNPEDILGGLQLGVEGNLEGLLEAMTRAMTELVQNAQNQLGIASPSRVFAGIGSQIMQGLAIGIGRSGSLPQMSMSQSMGQVYGAAVNAPSTMPTNSVSFGDMYVNNGMDAAMLRATIRREVVNMLG